jgi:cytochrome c peroxidase
LKKFFYILSLLGLGTFLSISSCKKDEASNPNYNGTLYDFKKVYRFPNIDVPADNPLTQASVDLGRMLFYDTQLSKSKTTSCASCHNQANAFSDNGLILSENDLGNATSRNASVLFNLVWTDKGFFWDGRKASIELAVEDALEAEQHPNWNTTLNNIKNDENYTLAFAKAFQNAEVSRENTIKAIASFLRIVVSNTSKYDLSVRGQATLTPLEQEGFDLIFATERGDCFHCHGVYPFMTDNDFHDNALQDASTLTEYVDKGLGGINGISTDIGKMKAPSLRNLSYSAPYMHDGRLATLDDVIDFYSEGLHVTPNVDPLMKNALQGGVQLSAQEKAALKAFLLTLDDPGFINNPEYGSPF